MMNFLVRQISANARVSTGFVQNVLKEYDVKNDSVPRKYLSGRNSVLMNDHTRSYLEREKSIHMLKATIAGFHCHAIKI